MPLLRPDQRFAHAGFPTKLVESLTLGTPVICNITSDIGKYVRDGVEGFVCRDSSVEAFTDALHRASTLSQAERAAMRVAAHEQATRSFDYRAHVHRLTDFVSSLSRTSGAHNGR
jgi:glycosyltransferase involved in cell wall biosynthesis